MDYEAFYNWANENSSAKEYADIMRTERVSITSMRSPDIVKDLTSFRDSSDNQLIPLLAAEEIVEAFSKYVRYGTVAIYWDIENVPPPRGVTAAQAANCLLTRLGEKHGTVCEFKTYFDPNIYKISDYDSVRLADCKVELIHAVHHDRKEVVDKMIIVDALWYAQEARRMKPSEPLPTICIVSGDSDFSPLISQLNRVGFHTICVSGGGKLRSIHQQATAAYTWSELGLQFKVPAPAYTTPPISGESNMPVEAPSSMPVEAPSSPVKSTMPELHDPIDDLREAILSCRDPAGPVRRSQAGLYFQKKNVSGKEFSEVVDLAVKKGVVAKGGTMGEAWVKLISQNKLYLMVVATGTYPDIPGCIRSLSCGNAHRFVYEFNDTAARSKFITTYKSNATGEQEIWFDDINKVDEFEKCYVDGACRRLSEFVQNPGYEYLLGHPDRSGRMCTSSTCHHGDNCRFIHLRGATPSTTLSAGSTAIASPSPGTPVPTTEAIRASLECLVKAIELSGRKRSGDGSDVEKQILRSQVGPKYDAPVPFKEITKIAEEMGLVALGGVAGYAWIKLLPVPGDN